MFFSFFIICFSVSDNFISLTFNDFSYSLKSKLLYLEFF